MRARALTPVATEVWTFTRPPSRTFVVNASAAATVYLDTQAVLRKERAARERRLAGLAVAVLTVLGERDAFVRDAERRASQALRMMTGDEGLSLRDRLVRQPHHFARDDPAAAARQRSSGRSRPTRRMSRSPGQVGRGVAYSATVRECAVPAAN